MFRIIGEFVTIATNKLILIMGILLLQILPPVILKHLQQFIKVVEIYKRKPSPSKGFRVFYLVEAII